ncbi:MAG TPA: low molecular weight phosphatase family protein [Candidatus Saccharimonadales bacterium]|nr:low molecular weight phosphatase family protein [Candidatus Saccharimonadales bacterium]
MPAATSPLRSHTKVLFICHANAGRSQMAMGFYNQLYPGMATSAGTEVDQPGGRVGDRPQAVHSVQAAREHGLDIGNNIRHQLTPELLDACDLAVVITNRATVPQYVLDSPKVEYWRVADPAGVPLKKAEEVRDHLEQRVRELAARLHPTHKEEL